MKIHELKVLPEFFEMLGDVKPFEARRDDRGFEVDDRLTLREWSPKDGYSGRVKFGFITYILRDAEQYGIKKGFAILGFKQFHVVRD